MLTREILWNKNVENALDVHSNRKSMQISRSGDIIVFVNMNNLY